MSTLGNRKKKRGNIEKKRKNKARLKRKVVFFFFNLSDISCNVAKKIKKKAKKSLSLQRRKALREKKKKG